MFIFSCMHSGLSFAISAVAPSKKNSLRLQNRGELAVVQIFEYLTCSNRSVLCHPWMTCTNASYSRRLFIGFSLACCSCRVVFFLVKILALSHVT